MIVLFYQLIESTPKKCYITLENLILNTIYSSISRLAKSQEEIAHVGDENVSVINISKVEMSENRQSLNKMMGSLAHLDVK